MQKSRRPWSSQAQYHCEPMNYRTGKYYSEKVHPPVTLKDLPFSNKSKFSPVTLQYLPFLNKKKHYSISERERKRNRNRNRNRHTTTRNQVTSDHTPPWPFLVGGVICFITSVDERYFVLLNGVTCDSSLITCFSEGLCVYNATKFEAEPHRTQT